MLESLAERLLELERLRADDVDEDAFADAKNDAVALRPLYLHVRQQAIQKFGKSILKFSASIGELDSIYSPSVRREYSKASRPPAGPAIGLLHALVQKQHETDEAETLAMIA